MEASAHVQHVTGIDLAAGRGVTALATLALEGAQRPRLLAITCPGSDDEIVEDVARARPTVIAVDAPLTLPGALAAAFTGDLWRGHPSLHTRGAERDPLWRGLGLRPLPVSFLSGLTTRAMPLAQRLRAAAPSATLIEVFPTASLRALGIQPRTGSRVSKTAREARHATQHGLRRWVAGLDDPDLAGGLLSADALDALAAALTAAAFARGATLAAGDPTEGCIIVIDAARYVARDT